jgi:MEMO1 family protein
MHPLVSLAKSSVENYITEKKIISAPLDFPKEFLEKRAGVFVTIEKISKLSGLPASKPKVLLRGCIGTYLPVYDNVAEEIIHNAIAAATKDWRFGKILKTELPRLSYVVYILGKPEKVADIGELDPEKFGIILKSGEKCGLLLPGLEGVNTAAEQIAICCQKGGIVLKQDNAEIYKFSVEKYDVK